MWLVEHLLSSVLAAKCCIFKFVSRCKTQSREKLLWQMEDIILEVLLCSRAHWSLRHSYDFCVFTPPAPLLCAGRPQPAATTWPNKATRWRRGWRPWTGTSSGSWPRWSATTTPPTSESASNTPNIRIWPSGRKNPENSLFNQTVKQLWLFFFSSRQIWSGWHRRGGQRVSRFIVQYPSQSIFSSAVSAVFNLLSVSSLLLILFPSFLFVSFAFLIVISSFQV